MFVIVSLLRYICYNFSVEVNLLQFLSGRLLVSLLRYVCYKFPVEVCLLQFL